VCVATSVLHCVRFTRTGRSDGDVAVQHRGAQPQGDISHVNTLKALYARNAP